jgi:glycosyltransferase involved in cell wall biosynthesis
VLTTVRLLFLSRWFPDPPDNGARLRAFNTLGLLAEQHEITLLSFAEPGQPQAANPSASLRERCRRIRVFPFRPYRPADPRALLGLLAPWPRSLVATHSPAMVRAVRDELRAQPYDLIVAAGLGMVPYVPAGAEPALLEELEVGTYHDAVAGATSRAARARAQLTCWKLGRYLRRRLPRFAVCAAASERELRLVERLAPGCTRLAVLPNAVDLASYPQDFGRPEPDSLIYAGALTYAANYDAVASFLRETYPLIARQVPGLRFRVTGSLEGVDLAGLPRPPGLVLTGRVPDVRPLVARSWASVVPLRRGSGTRLKILESLALGTPVVSTAKGAEGLAARDGQHLVIAEQPAEFAERVVSLLRSPALRCRLSSAGRRLVAEQYDLAVVGRTLRGLVAQAVGPGQT